MSLGKKRCQKINTAYTSGHRTRLQSRKKDNKTNTRNIQQNLKFYQHDKNRHNSMQNQIGYMTTNQGTYATAYRTKSNILQTWQQTKTAYTTAFRTELDTSRRWQQANTTAYWTKMYIWQIVIKLNITHIKNTNDTHAKEKENGPS